MKRQYALYSTFQTSIQYLRTRARSTLQSQKKPSEINEEKNVFLNP